MVGPEVIRRRLEAVSENLEVLERLAQDEEDEFIADPEHYQTASQSLQLALEALLDAASHAITDSGLGTVNQSRDIPPPVPGTRLH